MLRRAFARASGKTGVVSAPAVPVQQEMEWKWNEIMEWGDQMDRKE